MLKWIKQLFGGTNDDQSQEGFTFEFTDNHLNEKKEDTMGYHDGVDTQSYQEQETFVDTSTVIIGGKTVPMHVANQMLGLDGVAPGINVPGVGNFSGNQQRPQPPQRPPQGNHMNNGYNQQPPQHYPPQGYQQPPQYPQGYQQPPQPQYPPQGYPQPHVQQPQYQQPVEYQPQYQQPQPPPQQAPVYQQPVMQAGKPAVNASFYPATEIASTDSAYHIFIDLAGVSKELVSVVYKNDTLIISGTRSSKIDQLRTSLKGESDIDPILNYSTSVDSKLMGDFKYEYPFKKMVDESALKAQFETGILYVMLPLRVQGDSVAIQIM